MNIPTAEDFLRERYNLYKDIRSEDLIEFTKLHVKAALNAAYTNAKVWVDDDPQPFGGPFKGVEEESILNAYPLSNIK